MAEAKMDDQNLGFKTMRSGIKEAADENLLTPRFYTTDFEEMEVRVFPRCVTVVRRGGVPVIAARLTWACRWCTYSKCSLTSSTPSWTWRSSRRRSRSSRRTITRSTSFATTLSR
jgi:hypothetical protein